MKTFQKLAFPIVTGLLMASCVASKPFASEFKNEQKKGRDTTNALYVVKTDGEVVTAKKITYQYKMPLFRHGQLSVHSVVADGKKISFGKYQAVQTANVFKKLYYPESSNQFCDGIYINRLRFGKINLYQYEYVGETAYKYQTKPSYHDYVFEKESGKPASLDYQSFAEAIKDNSAVFEKFKQLFPGNTIPTTDVVQTLKKLTVITELYNQTSIDAMQASR